MCKISDKLKLCTCKTEDVKRLKHYWILKRHNGKNNCIIGEAILPANIGKQADKINETIILKMLNGGNCFDVELQLEENDILELHFTFNADPEKYLKLSWYGNYLAYAFIFQKDSWKKTHFDPFGENLYEVQKGKIVNPFART
ncbi:MAG: hypothetical protein NTZ41_05045 [Sphingobacteriales bacterium]|nr:hypothetical protein [Sphingobacteriales bacterium]